jgi:hypothetical protein
MYDDQIRLFAEILQAQKHFGAPDPEKAARQAMAVFSILRGARPLEQPADSANKVSAASLHPSN